MTVELVPRPVDEGVGLAIHKDPHHNEAVTSRGLVIGDDGDTGDSAVDEHGFAFIAAEVPDKGLVGEVREILRQAQFTCGAGGTSIGGEGRRPSNGGGHGECCLRTAPKGPRNGGHGWSSQLEIDGLAALADNDEFGEPHHIERAMEAVVLPELEADGNGESIESLGEKFAVVTIELALGIAVKRLAVVDDMLEPGHGAGGVWRLIGDAVRAEDRDGEHAEIDCGNAVVELGLASADVHRC